MKKNVVAIIVVFLSGCGTIVNLRSDKPEVYGGLRKDEETVEEAIETVLSNPHIDPNRTSWQRENHASFWMRVLFIPEASLTLVADTLTIPLALYLRPDPAEMNRVHWLNRETFMASVEQPFPTNQ